MTTHMTRDEIKAVVREAVAEAVQAERQQLWVDPEQHFLDHEMLRRCRENSEEWRRNHEFVAGLREGAEIMRKTGWRVAATSALTFLAVSVWLAIKEYVRR